MEWVGWKSGAHGIREEIPMLVIVVVDSTSNVATILEIFPGRKSLFVDLFQDIICLSAFLRKRLNSALSSVRIFFDGIGFKLIKLLVDVTSDLRNVSSCKSEPRCFNVVE